MAEQCMKKSEFKACCCNCIYHAQDNHHCTTTGKINGKCSCSKRRGYACVVRLMMDGGPIYSGWTKHGLCELHTTKAEMKEWRHAKSAGS